MLVGCVLLGLVPTTLILTQLSPRYSAEVKLVIEGPEASDLFQSGQNMITRQRPTEATVLTEAAILGSDLLLQRVIDHLDLGNDPEFNLSLRHATALETFFGALNPIGWLAQLTSPTISDDRLSPQAKSDVQKARIAKKVRSRLRIFPERRSYVISVFFTSENREKAALIANTLAKFYVNERLEASFDDAKRINTWLGERLASLKQDVTITEEAAERFRAANNLRRKGDSTGGGRGVTVSDQQLSEVSSRLMMAHAELAQKQARLDQLHRLLRTEGNVETSSDVLQSQLIQRLREQETTLHRELSDLQKTYGERHPRIIGYQAEAKELHQRINNEIEKVATSVANEVQVAQVGVQTLTSDLEALRHQTNQAGGAEVKLRELERQTDVSRSLYESFLARFKRDVDQEQVQRANARIVSPATAPPIPSWPPRVQTLSAALLLSFGFGIVLLHVLDHFDRAIRSADEAETVTGRPIMAVVPIYRGNTADMPTELQNRPRSALADAIRGLRVTLDLSDGEERCAPPQLIMVTSSMPKEGKTFVAMCLAAAMAKVESRVLLIDGDLYRPRLHTALNRSGEIGLAQVLAGTASLDEVIQRNVVDNLDLLPAGQLKTVADLMREPLMDPLLAALRQRYDRIILDAPPVLAVSDPRILARFADQLLYLIRWKSTPRDAVYNGIKLLNEANIAVDGIILSQVDQTKYSRYAYGDYGSYYGRYKEYYSE